MKEKFTLFMIIILIISLIIGIPIILVNMYLVLDEMRYSVSFISTGFISHLSSIHYNLTSIFILFK